jgi:3-keto-disaccharide hydrolase
MFWTENLTMPGFRWSLASFVVVMVLAVAAGAEESRELFNGKDLDGWVAEGVKEFKQHGKTVPVWSVKDGHLLCTGRGFGFLRYDREEFADFALHVEFKMAPKCNSGLGIRTRAFDPARSRATRPSFYSYEIQLTDDAGKPANTHSSGSLYRYVAPKMSAMKPAGEWNAIDVECRGPWIKVTLNGQEIIDVDQETIDALKDKPKKGYVCVQNHGGTIEFRNIRVSTIK